MPTYTDTTFTTNILPTSWTNSSDYKTATATNSYGDFKVYGDTIYSSSSSYAVANAVDSNTSSAWRLASMSSNTETKSLYIYLPDKIRISPTQITYTLYYTGNTATPTIFQGYNEDTKQWDTIFGASNITSKTTETIPICLDKFYSKFRLNVTRYNTTTPYIYDLKINTGIVRVYE